MYQILIVIPSYYNVSWQFENDFNIILRLIIFHKFLNILSGVLSVPYDI